MSAPAGGGVGVVMAGEGDRLDGDEGACEEGDGDDGGEGSGVLRLTVSCLGSAGMGVCWLWFLFYFRLYFCLWKFGGRSNWGSGWERGKLLPGSL